MMAIAFSSSNRAIFNAWPDTADCSVRHHFAHHAEGNGLWMTGLASRGRAPISGIRLRFRWRSLTHWSPHAVSRFLRCATVLAALAIFLIRLLVRVRASSVLESLAAPCTVVLCEESETRRWFNTKSCPPSGDKLTATIRALLRRSRRQTAAPDERTMTTAHRALISGGYCTETCRCVPEYAISPKDPQPEILPVL
jgi:hypothetical protein